MKRKILASLLTVGMLVSMMAGCGDSTNTENKDTEEKNTASESTADVAGDSTDEEPVLLRIFMRDQEQDADDEVAEYINNLPQVKELGVEIELVKMNGDYSNMPLLLAGDEQMDIGFDDANNFISRVNQNAYVDIKPYLENDPDFYDYIPDELWMGPTLNGGI